MAFLNLEEAGNLVKEHLNHKIKQKWKREIVKAGANHFAAFWWVYLIILGVFLFFYLIAAVISSGQSAVNQAFLSEKFFPPQIYKQNLEHLITDGFGERIDPISHARSFHTGLDIGVPKGTPVSSSQNGVVRIVSYPQPNDPQNVKDAGIYVTVESSDPDMRGTTRYLHLSEAFVIPGQVVKCGQIIGLSGNTGRTTGPHLHFEVIPKDSEPADPTNYILFMSKIIDVASDAALKLLPRFTFKELDRISYDYATKPMLYINHIYMRTLAPPFQETGAVINRRMEDNNYPAPAVELTTDGNTSESMSITFGVEQIYGWYAYEVNSSDSYDENGNVTGEDESYDTLIDPDTDEPIINLVKYNNVVTSNAFGDTEPPNMNTLDLPDAISITLESGSTEDLHVARIDYVRGY